MLPYFISCLYYSPSANHVPEVIPIYPMPARKLHRPKKALEKGFPFFQSLFSDHSVSFSMLSRSTAWKEGQAGFSFSTAVT